jgi:hypothetical protein
MTSGLRLGTARRMPRDAEDEPGQAAASHLLERWQRRELSLAATARHRCGWHDRLPGNWI